jgi:outer membrane protein OmpA-like peptidoglycan-associated protein
MKSFFSILLLCLLSLSLQAQQQSSKSKSSDKLYEKGELKNHVMMYNATGVNSPSLDFSPVFYQNGIVFVSSRYKSGPRDKKTGETFFELFYAEFNASGMPQSPRNFSLQINSQAHEGPVSFSRDGNLIYFTRNSSKASLKGEYQLNIYEARRGKYDWENVTGLPFNNNEYSCAHPALSADGSRLFFSSNMPGGYGGMDLYFVERRPDGWSKPINMGKDVNTPSNEGFPYFHESGTLFFSSNGHGGEGGLDIFMIDISTNAWGKLKNIGVPFNSTTDDLGIIVNEEGTRGFLASGRAGGYGKDDIYSFKAESPIIDGEPVTLSAMVVAYDEQTNERLPGADLRLFQRSAGGFIEGDDLYDVQLLPSENGDLVMKLVRKNPDDMGGTPLRTNINGETICEMRPEKNYLLLLTKEGYESAEMLYSTIGETEAQTIRVAMKPRSCTTVAGTVSVQDYQTLVPNALVRILNETTGTEELMRTNASGEFNYCLPLGHEYAVIAEKEGYTKGMSKVSTEGTNSAQVLNVNVHVQPIAENILKEPIKEGSVIVLENIYYDFDQYFIRKGAARDLDALAELMRLYPSMEIEMAAHTDSSGDEMYNQELSLKRAESAKRHLIQKGIAADRVMSFGMGESEIRNHCVDGVECTDEEHAYNRRTEVKIIHMDEPIRVEYKEGNPFDDGKGE